jgi:hypothetical protein
MDNIVPLGIAGSRVFEAQSQSSELGGFRLLPLSLLLKQLQKLKAEFQQENEKPCVRVQPGGKADDSKFDKF